MELRVVDRPHVSNILMIRENMLLKFIPPGALFRPKAAAQAMAYVKYAFNMFDTTRDLYT